MSFEIPSTKPKKEALDEIWYKRFEKFGAFQAYNYLDGNLDYRKQQKDQFLSRAIENPTLDYPKLENFDFEKTEQELLDLKKDVIQQEPNEIVKQAYRWRINEKIAELRMLRATKNGDNHRFFRYSKFIYGKPEENVHNYTLLKIKDVVEKQLTNPDEDIRLAAERLNKELFSNKEDLKSSVDIKSLDIKKSESVVNSPLLSSAEISHAFEAALEQYKLDGWSVVIEAGGATAVNVNQEKKSVIVPEKMTAYQKEMEPLIAHELGTHALRRESGERTRLHLLGLGLDRFLKGEEGVATYAEQKILGAEDFAGLLGHLKTALAVGIDGKPRNFRQVFEILKDYSFIISKKEKDKALKAAQDAAWTSCVRSFRGTSCQTPGACFTQDIVYREGNIGVWNVIKNNPDEEKRFSVGKYDPANPRHIWILEQLGINESDLNDLEK